jgi:hypothetical protein
MPEHSSLLSPLMIRGLSDADIELIFRELICIQQQEDCYLLQFESLVAANQYRLLYRLVRKYVATGSVVLDWGSGNGHCSQDMLFVNSSTNPTGLTSEISLFVST